MTEALVLHWQFEETPGSSIARDSSGNGNDGVLINAPLYTTGRIGQGMLFGELRGGAQDQRLRSTTTTFDTTGDLTVALWIYSYNVGSFDSFVDCFDDASANGFRIVANNDAPGQLTVTSDVSITLAQTGVGAFSYEVWQHLVVTRPASGNALQVFVNAVDMAVLRDSGAPVPNTTFQIGGGGSTTSDFNGVLDDVRVYTRLLSNAEIIQLFELGCT